MQLNEENCTEEATRILLRNFSSSFIFTADRRKAASINFLVSYKPKTTKQGRLIEVIL